MPNAFVRQKYFYFGTIKSIRREVPKVLTQLKGIPQYSSKFLFNKENTMVSYVRKKNSNVLLLSNIHHNTEIVETDKSKPRVIHDYNMHKSGVDKLDQIIKEYRPYRSTRRWPCAVFFDIIAFVSQACWVLYCVKSANSFLAKRKYRKEFLYQLGHQLVVPTIIKRKLSTEYSYLHRDVKLCMCYMIKYCEDSLQSQRQGISMASYRNNSSLLNVPSPNETPIPQPDIDIIAPQLLSTQLPNADLQDILPSGIQQPDIQLSDDSVTRGSYIRCSATECSSKCSSTSHGSGAIP